MSCIITVRRDVFFNKDTNAMGYADKGIEDGP